MKKNISLDTCFWFGLLRTDLYGEESVFEEICFWIENDHVNHLVPENVIREWDRNKVGVAQEFVSKMHGLSKNITSRSLQSNPQITAPFEREALEAEVQKRIERVDLILKTISELAPETPEIIAEAAERCLNKIAPNHKKDSFRDTVNILSLIHHVKNKGYQSCIFSTINYDDFSAVGKRYDLHPQLVNLFKDASLEYVYCDEDPFAGKLLGVYLRKQLPSFQDFIKDKRKAEEAAMLEEIKATPTVIIPNADKNFIDNIKWIDLLIAKTDINEVEKEMLNLIIKSHPSYEQYFLRKVGEK